MEKNYKYFAFISYKREDEEWAKWLQHKLEHYRLPLKLREKNPELPKEIRPVFKDTSELAGGVLAKEINEALEDSKYLIVICSPRSAKSEWVCKEVQTFIDLGRTEQIIPFIIGGTPHSANADDECFPTALLSIPKEQELLAININEMGRDAAAIKVVAQMFDIYFDELWQRRRREKKRDQLICGVVVILIIIFLSFIAIKLYTQNVEIHKNYDGMLEMQSKVVTKIAQEIKSPVHSIAMLLDVLPKNYNNPDRPYTQEAGTALLNLLDTTRLEKVIPFKEEIFDVKISPDESRILVASRKQINVYDLKTWKNIISIPCKDGYISNVSFGVDASKLLYSTKEIIILWDIESNTKIFHIKDHSIDKITLSPDRTKILVSHPHRNFNIYNSLNGQLICKLIIPENITTFVGELPVFYTNGSKLILNTASSKALVFNSQTGKIIKNECFDKAELYAFSPDGRKIVLINNGSSFGSGVKGKIVIKDIITDSILLTIDTSKQIKSIDFNPSCTQIIVTPLYENTIIVYDINSGKELITLNHPYFMNNYAEKKESGYIKQAYFRNGKIITATNDRVCLWDKYYYGNTPYDCIDILIEGEGCFKYCKFLKYQEKIVSASSHELLVWNMSKKRKSYGQYMMNCDSSRIIGSPYNKKVEVYDALTRTKIFELKGHRDKINTALFSHDGKKIITSSDDSTTRVWDANTSEQILCLTNHTSKVKSAVFSYDDKTILTTSEDQTCRLWDTYTGDVLMAINPFQELNLSEVPWSAKISPDGTKIGVVTHHYGARRNQYQEMKEYDTDNLYVFNAKTGNFLWSPNIDTFTCSVAFSSDGTAILVGNTNKKTLYDFNSGKILQEYNNLKGEGELIFSDDRKEFIIYDGGSAVYRYCTSTGELLLKLDLSNKIYRSYSANGTHKDDYGFVDDLKSSIWEHTNIQSFIDCGNKILNGYKLSSEDKQKYYLE